MRVEKRNGKIVDFNAEKIEIAIQKAMSEVEGGMDEELSKRIAASAEEHFQVKDVISIEEIQDYVEIELMRFTPEVAKNYIIYRVQRAKLREHGWDMTDLQRDIYEKKYRYDDENFDDFLTRVSGGDDETIKKYIRDKKFMPAGRILAGRGLDKHGRKLTLSNCYVMPKVEDNIEDIFDIAKYMARTYSYGGGVGLNLSKLRPRGARVNNAASTTTGAVSFMDLYSLVTGLIGMKGRRGALMLNMDIQHPDIEDFIDVKNDLSKVNFANISVNVSDEFMQAVEDDRDFKLRFTVEASGEVVERNINARSLFKKIARNNWNMAEPGILFQDRIDSWHLMSEDEDFSYAGVNPCAEEPLPAFGSCNLSSINLSEFVKKPYTPEAYIDWISLRQMVRDGVIYLNDALDENMLLHPLKKQQEVSADLRQIGLGLMGTADMFIKLGVRYGSDESIALIEKLGETLINEALQQSALLAKEHGPFPLYKKEKVMASPFFKANANEKTVEMVEAYGLRNSQLLTIAPTGSISTLIGCSNGLEPIFQVAYTRKSESLHNQDTYYKVFTPIIKEYMEVNDIKTEEELPDFIVTTSNLKYKERIDVQSAWQQYIDASISSTVNLPEETTVEEVEDLYRYAWEKGLKGITVYRDGCARSGILITENRKRKSASDRILELKMEIDDIAAAELERNPGTCPICGGPMNHSGGCEECQDCGYSPCAI